MVKATPPRITIVVCIPTQPLLSESFWLSSPPGKKAAEPRKRNARGRIKEPRIWIRYLKSRRRWVATMLAFLGTDAAISAPNLRKVLKKSADLSFNSITIDATSTNDMLLILANGTAGNRPITPGSGEYEAFSKLVLTSCQELATMIVKDGEGTTKFI